MSHRRPPRSVAGLGAPWLNSLVKVLERIRQGSLPAAVVLLAVGSVWGITYEIDGTLPDGGDCPSFGVWDEARKSCVVQSVRPVTMRCDSGDDALSIRRTIPRQIVQSRIGNVSGRVQLHTWAEYRSSRGV